MGGEITLFGVSPVEFHDWDTSPADWKAFEDYCKRDVDAEAEILYLIPTPLPQREQDLWVLDQIINERGIPTNRKFSETCFNFAERNRDLLEIDLLAKTGLENPNSPEQLTLLVKTARISTYVLDKKFVEPL